MVRASVAVWSIALAVVLSGLSCDRLGGGSAAAAPAATGPAPAPAPAPAPTGSAAAAAPTPAPGAPGAPATPAPGTAQTIELPGLGSITVDLSGGPLAGAAAPPGGGAPAATSPTPRVRVEPAPPPPDGVTLTGSLTPGFMMAETRAIHQALVAALPDSERGRLVGVPLEIANDQVEPNAAAACTEGTRQPVMLITAAMITLAGGIAETRAYDELASASTYEQYARQVVDQLRGNMPVTGVPPGLVAGPMARDPRKLARERQLFQEQIAFILGHELAHHHRGHTGCVSGGDPGRADAEELARIASSVVPTFTQPLEVEADTWAVYNVLAAGDGRPGGSWDEEGGLVNLEFFGRLRDMGGGDVLGAFLSTHPMPQIRRPIIEAAARQWSRGTWPPSTPGGLTLPGGAVLPIQLPGLTTP